MEFNHFYKDFGQFDFFFVINYTGTKTIEGMLSPFYCAKIDVFWDDFFETERI